MGLVDTHSNGLGWLLDQQLGDFPGVGCAVLASGDGLLQARTQELTQEYAERLAALSSSMASTGKAISMVTGAGPVRQHLVEFERRLFLAAEAGDNSVLMVVTTDLEADVGAIIGRMVELSSRVGHAMGVAARRPETEGEGPSGREPGSPT
ncbi:roadblock/LC7 domain-containing protein [Streptomyces sp. NPDC002586]